MTDNIRDITEGKIVRDLLYVFAQINPAGLFNEPKMPKPEPTLERRYPSACRRSVMASLRRVAADLENGVVSQREFDAVELRCRSALKDEELPW